MTRRRATPARAADLDLERLTELDESRAILEYLERTYPRRAGVSWRMTRVVDPTPESFRALSHNVPAGVPVVMLNLLRYREAAAYPVGSPHEACSGREAYARYTAHALRAVTAAGGEVVFHGSALAHPIAPPDERWDEILLVAYPSVGAFLKMVMAPDYQAQSVHRTAALEDARLVCVRRG